MLRWLILIVLFIQAGNSNAQLTSGNGHVMHKYSYGSVDTAQYHLYSLSGEYFLNEYIGLNYNFDLQFRNDGLRQFHSSIGALAGPPLILLGILTSLGDDDWNDADLNLGPVGILLGIAILIAPDGVCFHIPVSYRWDLSPYVNVLGVDYIRNKTQNDNYFKYAMSYGLKTTYLTSGNLTLNAFLETRKVAGQGWGFGGGLGLGYMIN